MYQWTDKRGKRINYVNYYHDWLFGRRTLSEICSRLDISYPKLISEFDKIEVPEGLQCASPAKPVNLLIDATFFGREYGYLCFHDTKRIIYFSEIKTETVADLVSGLLDIKQAGYRIASVTIDGRRGYYRNLRKILGNIPIQMCIFHQKAIVRRYITDKPKSACGMELKELMATLCHPDHQKFIDRFSALQEKYKYFLAERNLTGGYKHGRIKAAFRSIDDTMPYIFTYRDVRWANIPPTINHLEGAFSHLKEKISIHRGLSKQRKKNAIRFILKNL